MAELEMRRVQFPKMNSRSTRIEQVSLRNTIEKTVEALSQNQYIDFEGYLQALFILKINKYLGSGDDRTEQHSKQ